jgi:spore coat protein U-like protein
MPMKSFALILCFALLPNWAQSALPSARKPGDGGGGGPGIDCPLRPAECQVNAPVFNFGRAEMSATAPPVNAHATISVTCTRAPLDGLDVEVIFELQGLPPAPSRQMRNATGGDSLRYEMFLDPARTRYWGDGTQGTFTLPGTLILNDRNRVGTLAFPLYGRVDGGQHPIEPGQWLGAVVTRLQYNPICH